MGGGGDGGTVARETRSLSGGGCVGRTHGEWGKMRRLVRL